MSNFFKDVRDARFNKEFQALATPITDMANKHILGIDTALRREEFEKRNRSSSAISPDQSSARTNQIPEDTAPSPVKGALSNAIGNAEASKAIANTVGTKQQSPSVFGGSPGKVQNQPQQKPANIPQPIGQGTRTSAMELAPNGSKNKEFTKSVIQNNVNASVGITDEQRQKVKDLVHSGASYSQITGLVNKYAPNPILKAQWMKELNAIGVTPPPSTGIVQDEQIEDLKQRTSNIARGLGDEFGYVDIEPAVKALTQGQSTDAVLGKSIAQTSDSWTSKLISFENWDEDLDFRGGLLRFGLTLMGGGDINTAWNAAEENYSKSFNKRKRQGMFDEMMDSGYSREQVMAWVNDGNPNHLQSYETIEGEHGSLYERDRQTGKTNVLRGEQDRFVYETDKRTGAIAKINQRTGERQIEDKYSYTTDPTTGARIETNLRTGKRTVDDSYGYSYDPNLGIIETNLKTGQKNFKGFGGIDKSGKASASSSKTTSTGGGGRFQSEFPGTGARDQLLASTLASYDEKAAEDPTAYSDISGAMGSAFYGSLGGVGRALASNTGNWFGSDDTRAYNEAWTARRSFVSWPLRLATGAVAKEEEMDQLSSEFFTMSANEPIESRQRKKRLRDLITSQAAAIERGQKVAAIPAADFRLMASGKAQPIRDRQTGLVVGIQYPNGENVTYEPLSQEEINRRMTSIREEIKTSVESEGF